MRKFWVPTLGLVAAVVLSISGALAADKASQKFMTEVMQGNLAEIAVGKLAQQKGQSEGVRSFGSMLVSDHSAANEKAMSVAQGLGVSPPNEPSKKQKAVYDRLSKLSGESFDHEFAKAMVEDHKNDIREFEKEAKKKNDPAAEFANETLPTLRKHLEMAQSLASGKSASR
jgi:putative membrane protein